ncbi:translesion DNA synthesis-associated protein ImuA [Acidovorax sp.]|uniref:translesion DNA synthesis-associated protein ImuA n=1 Tax=Acidovorax sp. TaxID=1872122 RepID=UPI00391F4D3E
MAPALHSFDQLVLPQGVREAVWLGSELGHQDSETVATGFSALDAALPGRGWPTRSLTEVLAPQAPLCEWRLLGGSLQQLVADGGQILLVSPPQQPHAGGLVQLGVPADRLVWIQARTPAERLWATEQLVKSNPKGAVLAWLPQARAEQIRRLQVHAQSCQAPVFLFRPLSAEREASPAPLRIQVSLGVGWNIDVRVLKRRGTPYRDVLPLPAIPGRLDLVLPPRLRRLGTENVIPLRNQEATHDRDLGRTAPHQEPRVLHGH